MSTNLYPSKRPKVAEVERWDLIAIQNSGIRQFMVERGEPFPDFYRVTTFDVERNPLKKSKLFYGESAWMDVNRYVRDFGFYAWEGI